MPRCCYCTQIYRSQEVASACEANHRMLPTTDAERDAYRKERDAISCAQRMHVTMGQAREHGPFARIALGGAK